LPMQFPVGIIWMHCSMYSKVAHIVVNMDPAH